MKSQLPPFTLKEAEREMLRIEDMASLTRDGHNALFHIVANLILELKNSGAIDSQRFADNMKDLHHKAKTDDDFPLHNSLGVYLTLLLPLLESDTTTDDDVYHGQVH